MVKFIDVGFFLVSMITKDVDVMKCILCYNSLVLFCDLKIQTRKGLIIYNTTNRITTLKKTWMQTILLS
jgi:hypothetical protein